MDDKRCSSFNVDLETGRATIGLNDCGEDTAFSLIEGAQKPEEVRVSFDEHGILRSFHYQGYGAKKLLDELQAKQRWAIDWNLVNGLILTALIFAGLGVAAYFNQRPQPNLLNRQPSNTFNLN